MDWVVRCYRRKRKTAMTATMNPQCNTQNTIKLSVLCESSNILCCRTANIER